MVDALQRPQPPATQGEPAWVALARGSDEQREAALHELHGRHKDEVFSFLLKLLQDRALAEDVLQDSFLKVHAAFDRYDPERPFRPWLFQIVRNTALTALRTRNKRGKSADLQDDDAVAPEEPFRDAASREAVATTRRVLDSLPVESQAILVERHVHGRKLGDLARSWSCTTRTVTNRLRAAADEFARALVARRSREGGRS